jgi:hypothetical protein
MTIQVRDQPKPNGPVISGTMMNISGSKRLSDSNGLLKDS